MPFAQATSMPIAGGRSGDPTPDVPLGPLVDAVLDRLRSSTDADHALHIDVDPNHRLDRDASLAELLIESVVRMAYREMPGGGELAIVSVAMPDGSMEIEVADTGAPSEQQA